MVTGHAGFDVYVTLSADAPKTDGTPEGHATAADRIGQLIADPTMPWGAKDSWEKQYDAALAELDAVAAKRQAPEPNLNEQ